MELEHLPQAVPKLNQEALKSLRWAFPDAEWKVGVGGGGDWQEKWGGALKVPETSVMPEENHFLQKPVDTT